jgi:hypothetical protein
LLFGISVLTDNFPVLYSTYILHFPVLYFCLLLPLLLAVVQGAESLAGWKLNFSVPRSVNIALNKK